MNDGLMAIEGDKETNQRIPHKGAQGTGAYCCEWAFPLCDA